MPASANENQVAIVTGASSGIGLGITTALLERGHRVVANSRTINKSTELQPSPELVLIDGDIEKKETAVVLRRRDNSEYHRVLEKVLAPLRPNVATESGSVNSLITEVGIGTSVAVVSQIFKEAIGKRLLYRPLAHATAAMYVGIAHAKNGDVTPGGEKLCAAIRKAARV
jgi:NAD(P)-dependent dehydrogenase (short-subunit alcohol dehydrogenase family)